MVSSLNMSDQGHFFSLLKKNSLYFLKILIEIHFGLKNYSKTTNNVINNNNNNNNIKMGIKKL